MSAGDDWVPYRPTEEDLARIEADVAEVAAIQGRLVGKCPALHGNDRVAHQYQISGGEVRLRIANELPKVLNGLGLFQPGALFHGIGRISTGLGSPHSETQPDFLGIMTAFQTEGGRRVDLLAINDPTAPTDNHRDFVSVLYATGESAGGRIPFVGDWGHYDAGNWIAQQLEFGLALERRIGLVKAGKTIAHIVKQTSRTFRSSTAYQTYWTGIVEANGTAGKFTFVPARDDNHSPGFRPGELHLTDEWRDRQRAGDIEFLLYWIAFLDEQRTPLTKLTDPWHEAHKELIGTITFPRTDSDSTDAKLWATLANAMGANPGNWIADRAHTIRQPATEFGAARKIAYRISQTGRGALDPNLYAAVFTTGEIDAALAQELTRRATR